MENKPFYLSKTLLVNVLVMALGTFCAACSAWISANPDVLVYAVAGINILLRLVTKTQIVLK